MISQNDPLWKLKRINGTTSTIGSYGCLISCICYILQKAGYNINPDQLAVQKELFDGTEGSKDMWVGWDKLQTLYPNVSYIWGEKCIATPAPIDKIISEVRDGYYPIIMLDYAPKVTGMQTHCLVVTDADSNGNLKVGDPIDGADVWLDTRYGTLDEKYKILKVDVYHFTKPAVPTDKWDNIKLFLEEQNADEGRVREAFGALADSRPLKDQIASLQNALNSKQATITTKDGIISDLKNELDGANTIIHTKNGYREKLALMLGCAADWDEIVREVTVAIGNEDKYNGLLKENSILKGTLEEQVAEKVASITYDINLKLIKANTDLVTLSNKNNALTKQVDDLKSIINGSKITLIDKIKKLLKIK